MKERNTKFREKGYLKIFYGETMKVTIHVPIIDKKTKYKVTKHAFVNVCL